jgi:hypothetical protein
VASQTLLVFAGAIQNVEGSVSKIGLKLNQTGCRQWPRTLLLELVGGN